MRFEQTVITSLGVLKTRPHDGPEGSPADVNCPVCGTLVVEQWMRAVVFKGDPMRCVHGHVFVAADIPGMWK